MRPFLDVTRVGWTGEDGDTTNIYEHIDEVSVNDADYVRSSQSPVSDVYVFKLSPVTDPLISTGHIIRVRFGKDIAGGDILDMTLELRQGYVSEVSQGTLIGSISAGNIAGGWTDFVYEIPGIVVDAITDYSNLFLRFIARKS